MHRRLFLVSFLFFPASSRAVAESVTIVAGRDNTIFVGDESTSGTVRRFDTREAADPALRPVLTVEYVAVPEPATTALVLMTIAASVCLPLGSRTAK